MEDKNQQPETRKTTSAKATETVRRVRSIVKNMYRDAAEAKAAGKPVAYCMVGSQYDEILRAMDIFTLWTENYSGLCAAKRAAERFILKAEGDGYSNVICGYVRTGIGYEALRKECGGCIPRDSPDGGMVMPDMLLGSSYACDPRFKWYQALGRYMNVPTYAFDVITPPVTADLDQVRDYYVRYQTRQLRGLVDFLETQTKKKLDPDRLMEILKISDEIYLMWYLVDRLRVAIPSPMPSEDHYSAMVPSHFRGGTIEALDFYKDLYNEVKQRVENKVGVIPNEKYRILFGGGLPPWHTMWIFNYFESQGAVFAIENAYRSYDPVEVPPHVQDPLEYIAWRTFLRATHWFDKAKKRSGNPVVERLIELAADYKIDGVVFHASRSCRASTVGQLYRKELLQRYIDLPAMQLISDIVDLRDYSEAQWKSQIDTFVEAVDAHKNKRL